jgi:hypothetical protein
MLVRAPDNSLSGFESPKWEQGLPLSPTLSVAAPFIAGVSLALTADEHHSSTKQSVKELVQFNLTLNELNAQVVDERASTNPVYAPFKPVTRSVAVALATATLWTAAATTCAILGACNLFQKD